MEHLIIGTAGHVDHGKTSLIRALTGLDTDRLKEEKERGISIDLGFAYLTLPDGRKVGIIDVPGHERFIKNMLAGAGGVDLVLLVVAADEGVMPQTREHLAILDLLGSKEGIVVLTKKDLVDEEWLQMVEESVREFVAGTFLARAPLQAVSTVTGEGIEELKKQIFTLLARLDPKRDKNFLFYPIDRVFTITGFGTVVTGTLLSGTVSLEDRVEILPEGIEARVRSLQVHGEPVKQAFPGQRVAINLAGVRHEQIGRGSVAVIAGSVKPTDLLDVRLGLLAETAKPLAYGSRVRVHLGTTEVLGRVRLLDREEVAPGKEAVAQIFLEEPVVARKDMPFVLRSYSPVATIGGGKVIDPNPSRHKRYQKDVLERLEVLEQGGDRELLEKYLQEAGIVEEKKLDRFGDAVKVLEAEGFLQRMPEGFIILTQTFGQWKGKVRRVLEAFHQENPLRKGMDRENLRQKALPFLELRPYQVLLAALRDDGEIILDKQFVALANFSPRFTGEWLAIKEKLEQSILGAGFSPPGKKEIFASLPFAAGKKEKVWDAMLEQGLLVELPGEVVFHRKQVEEAKDFLLSHFARNPQLTLAQFRDHLGTSRKYALPLLEYFDSLKLTKRQGDVRVRC